MNRLDYVMCFISQIDRMSDEELKQVRLRIDIVQAMRETEKLEVNQ